MSNLFKSKFLLGVMVLGALVLGAVATTSVASAAGACDTSPLTHTLKYHNTYTGENKCLQTLLGLSLVDGIFGNGTKTAVKSFQTANALTSDGIVGAHTRAMLTGSGSVMPSPTPTGTLCPDGIHTIASNCTLTPSNGGGQVVSGSVTVSLASSNPASTIVATGTANNAMLAFNVANGTTGSVNVTSLKLTKTGYYSNTNISGVSVLDGNGMRHGNVVTTLGANGVAMMTFNTDPIVVAAGQSTTVWVKVNLASTSSTGTLGFNVAATTDITTSGGTIGGSFPIVGNQMSIVNGSSSIAVVTLDEMPVNASGAYYNADPVAEQDIAKFRVRETSSNEDVKLSGLTIWNNGNSAATDYKDVQLVDQTGNVLATAQPMGQQVQFVLSTPFMILKGQTKDFTVRAKIIDGASRTIQFTVYNDYDLNVMGMSTMAGLLPSAGSTDTSFPIGDAGSNYNLININSGTLTFSRATDSPSTSVTPNASDVVLAKFNAKPIGEDMELRAISFGLDQNTGSAGLTGTVYVKVNGATVYSAAANSTNFALAGTAAARSLSSYPILTAGQNNTIEVVASIDSAADATDAYFVHQFDVTSVKRLLTNDITDPGVATQEGFTRTVQAASLTVSTLATPVAGSIVPGTNAVNLAKFDFNASASGEDVRVTSVTVTDTRVGGAFTDITNLVMKDAAGNQLTTSSSTAVNANTVLFTFTTPVVVTRGTPVTLSLFGDISSAATAASQTHTYKIASGNVAATGLSTGNSIASPSISGSGQAMTIVSGGVLNISTDSGTGKTPSVTQLATVGQNDGIYLAARLTSQYEAQKITSLTLNAYGTTLTQNNLSNIRLYAQTGTGALSGSTMPFASVSQFDATCSGNSCTHTWTATDNLLPMQIVPATSVTIFVKADIQPAGTAMLGNDFYMSMDTDGDMIAKGAVSSSEPTYDANYAENSGAHTFIVPFQVLVSGETPTASTSTTTTIAVGTQLGRFKVMNNGSSQVTLTTVKLNDNGSHTATDWTYKLYASDENSNNYLGTQIDNDGTDNSNVMDFGALDSTVTINGGSYRYITVTLQAGTVATGDSVQLGVAALGDILYSADESALNYDGEQDGDLTGTITGLYTDGKPSLGTLIKS